MISTNSHNISTKGASILGERDWDICILHGVFIDYFSLPLAGVVFFGNLGTHYNRDWATVYRVARLGLYDAMTFWRWDGRSPGRVLHRYAFCSSNNNCTVEPLILRVETCFLVHFA